MSAVGVLVSCNNIYRVLQEMENADEVKSDRICLACYGSDGFLFCLWFCV